MMFPRIFLRDICTITAALYIDDIMMMVVRLQYSNHALDGKPAWYEVNEDKPGRENIGHVVKEVGVWDAIDSRIAGETQEEDVCDVFGSVRRQ